MNKTTQNENHALKQIKRRSMMREALERLVRNKTAMSGLFILLVIAILCALAGVICPEGYDEQNYAIAFMTPCKEYPFGTDNLGRSMLARILYGGRVSLSIGLISTGISASLGLILGSLAGFYGNKVDNIIMRTLDVFHAIPSTLLAIAISSALGGGIVNAMIAVGISSVPSFAKMVRAPHPCHQESGICGSSALYRRLRLAYHFQARGSQRALPCDYHHYRSAGSCGSGSLLPELPGTGRSAAYAGVGFSDCKLQTVHPGLSLPGHFSGYRHCNCRSVHEPVRRRPARCT